MNSVEHPWPVHSYHPFADPLHRVQFAQRLSFHCRPDQAPRENASRRPLAEEESTLEVIETPVEDTQIMVESTRFSAISFTFWQGHFVMNRQPIEE